MMAIYENFSASDQHGKDVISILYTALISSPQPPLPAYVDKWTTDLALDLKD